MAFFHSCLLLLIYSSIPNITMASACSVAHDRHLSSNSLPFRQLPDDLPNKHEFFNDPLCHDGANLTSPLLQRRKKPTSSKSLRLRSQCWAENHEPRLFPQPRLPDVSVVYGQQSSALPTLSPWSTHFEDVHANQAYFLSTEPCNGTARVGSSKLHSSSEPHDQISRALLPPISFSPHLEHRQFGSSPTKTNKTQWCSGSENPSSYVFYPPRNPSDTVKPLSRPDSIAPRRRLSYGEPPYTAEPRSLHEAFGSNVLPDAGLPSRIGAFDLDEYEGPETSAIKPYHSEPTRGNSRLYLDLVNETSRIERAVSLPVAAEALSIVLGI